MATRAVAGLGLIVALALGVLGIAELSTLGDAGVAATSGATADLFTSIYPISFIVLGGLAVMVMVMAAVKLFRH